MDWFIRSNTMASQSGYNDAGSSGHGVSSSKQLGSRDLPSKRLLGTGVASVGYETELYGEKVARKDFIGVPSGIFVKEAAVLVGLRDHIYVVKTRGWAVNKMSCSLVLEYVDDDLVGLSQKRKQSLKTSPEAGTSSGDQSDRTRTSPPFQLREALGIMEQIAIGMEHLHDQGILHGDLKTKNILATGGDQNSVSVKVADFGLVGTKRKSTSFASRQARKLDMARWKAPEILEVLLAEDIDETSSDSDSESCDEEYSGSSDRVTDWRLFDDADVYSFGVTCCQILTGEDPYPNPNWRELMSSIVSGELRPTLPAACPPQLRVLLESCWSKKSRRGSDDVSSSRPTFSCIRWKLERLRRLLGTTELYLDSGDYSRVSDSIEFLLEQTWKVVRCDAECRGLRGKLSSIQMIILDLSECRFDHVRESECLERVKDWLTRLQHELHVTAIYVRKCHRSVPGHIIDRYFPARSLQSKLSTQIGEIIKLAKQGFELVTPVTLVGLGHYSFRPEQMLMSVDRFEQPENLYFDWGVDGPLDPVRDIVLEVDRPGRPITVPIRLSRPLDIGNIRRHLELSGFGMAIRYDLSGNSDIIRVYGFPPLLDFGPLDVLGIVREVDSGAEIEQSSSSIADKALSNATNGSSDAGTASMPEKVQAAPNVGSSLTLKDSDDWFFKG